MDNTAIDDILPKVYDAVEALDAQDKCVQSLTELQHKIATTEAELIPIQNNPARAEKISRLDRLRRQKAVKEDIAIRLFHLKQNHTMQKELLNAHIPGSKPGNVYVSVNDNKATIFLELDTVAPKDTANGIDLSHEVTTVTDTETQFQVTTENLHPPSSEVTSVPEDVVLTVKKELIPLQWCTLKPSSSIIRFSSSSEHTFFVDLDIECLPFLATRTGPSSPRAQLAHHLRFGNIQTRIKQAKAKHRHRANLIMLRQPKPLNSGLEIVIDPLAIKHHTLGNYYWESHGITRRSADPLPSRTTWSKELSVQRIRIPTNVNVIETSACENFINLEFVSFDKSDRQTDRTTVAIEDFAFSNCSALKSVVGRISVSRIGAYAFYKCPSLRSTLFLTGATTKRISCNAFMSCTSLQTVVVPEGVTSIGPSAFEKCRKLKFLSLPQSLLQIEARAFSDCSSLERLVLPARLTTTSIDVTAFEDCTGLTHVSVPTTFTDEKTKRLTVIQKYFPGAISTCYTPHS